MPRLASARDFHRARGFAHESRHVFGKAQALAALLRRRWRRGSPGLFLRRCLALLGGAFCTPRSFRFVRPGIDRWLFGVTAPALLCRLVPRRSRLARRRGARLLCPALSRMAFAVARRGSMGPLATGRGFLLAMTLVAAARRLRRRFLAAASRSLAVCATSASAPPFSGSGDIFL